MPYLSIVIPAYNEIKKIGPTLSKIGSFLGTKSYDFEIIVIDDGSVDGTALAAEESDLAKAHKLKVIRNDKNKGKGFSVRNGIAHSEGEYVLLCDADLSAPIEEIGVLFDSIKSGYDIVIGSRAMKESRINIHQPWYREIMGKIFNFFVKMLVIEDFSDTQCGFKLFSGGAARDIARQMKTSGFCFDVEMLYLAKIKGYNVREAGVIWGHFPGSKVRLFSSSVEMFLDLLRIRIRHRKIKRNRK